MQQRLTPAALHAARSLTPPPLSPAPLPGVDDDKGGLLNPVHAVEAFLKTAGKLPLNVKFLLEGQEEIGSPNLEAFLKKHKEGLLAGIDVALSADGGQISATQVSGGGAADAHARVRWGFASQARASTAVEAMSALAALAHTRRCRRLPPPPPCHCSRAS